MFFLTAFLWALNEKKISQHTKRHRGSHHRNTNTIRQYSRSLFTAIHISIVRWWATLKKRLWYMLSICYLESHITATRLQWHLDSFGFQYSNTQDSLLKDNPLLLWLWFPKCFIQSFQCWYKIIFFQTVLTCSKCRPLMNAGLNERVMFLFPDWLSQF